MATRLIHLGKRYAELLTSIGILTEEQVNRAIAEQDKTRENLDTILIRNEVIDQEALLKGIAEHFKLATVDASKATIEPDILNMVPVRIVHRYNILPLSYKNNILKVVTADPLNFHAIDDIRMLLRCEVELVLGLSLEITEAIKRYYGIGADTLDSLMTEDGFAELEGVESEMEDASEDASIIRFVNQIVSEAIRDRSTDIHFEPFEDELRIRYRIDGLLYEASVPPSIRHYQSAVISRIKIMADMNIAEKRIPQDGRIPFRLDNQEYDFRVSTVPTPFGESISIRILNRTGTFYRLSDLGMDQETHRKFTELINLPHGIVLVTGPTGSGKTTTLYGALDILNKPEVKIVTVEDPIEYQMRGITQVQVLPKIDLTFARILRAFLRQDPDIMLVGETRDSETAEITIRAALTGHLVFSTLHTNDAAGAFTRLLDMGIESYLVASSVIGVLAQRLVRVICNNCKEVCHPDPVQLEGMGLPRHMASELELYRGRGCEACKFLGYKGRTGIYEIIPISERIKELTMERASANILKKAALDEGMKTLRQDGWLKVLSGVTTIEEVLRVTQEDSFSEMSGKAGSEIKQMTDAMAKQNIALNDDVVV